MKYLLPATSYMKTHPALLYALTIAAVLFTPTVWAIISPNSIGNIYVSYKASSPLQWDL